jgi:hypothetical protein
MANILDRFARNPSPPTYSRFLPESTGELFALRLASKLDDVVAVGHYVELVQQHSEESLLIAYRRVYSSGTVSDPARRFHVELARLNGRNGHELMTKWLIAIRIERRAVAVAVSYGTTLEHAQVRQLSSSSDKAIASAAIFIERILERFPAESVAVEVIPDAWEFQRLQIFRAITGVLTSRGATISHVTKQEVFEAFGYPRLKSRKELRAVIGAIWPILGDYGGSLYIQDAVALGLYVQTECLFNL